MPTPDGDGKSVALVARHGCGVKNGESPFGITILFPGELVGHDTHKVPVYDNDFEYATHPHFERTIWQGTNLIKSVVFVHGLFGHLTKTWTLLTGKPIDEATAPEHNRARMRQQDPDKTEIFWPKDLLPLMFPKARIMTWGYDSQINHVISSASKATLLHHSETLLTDLLAVRQKELEHKPIIFIAHSLGGIVVKDALSIAANDLHFRDPILSATKGVMFLGTPHHGSHAASFGKIAFQISRVFLQSPNVGLLRSLEGDSEVLERVSKSFAAVLAAEKFHVHSFREELPTKGIMVVPSTSAIMGHACETRGSLHANHREMAKMESLVDVKFRRVTSVLIRWLDALFPAPPLALANSKSETQPKNRDTILSALYTTCLQSLRSPNAGERYDAIESACEGTLDWIFDKNLGFTSFLKAPGSDSAFWIRGKPGSGKSTAMKHIMKHKITRSCLEEHDKSPWTIAGFFFHDRGSANQKSVSGFLQYTLFQVLQKQKELFPFVTGMVSEAIETKNRSESWTPERVLSALRDISEQTETPANIFLCIDALDEHDSNHRILLDAIDELLSLGKSPLFHLRLCLASRPDNIFKDRFCLFPGFAIHEHSSEDMKSYIQQRIRNESKQQLTERGGTELNSLADNVHNRAQGVFMWVRIVVDELVEGLREGDSMRELEDLVSTLPPELGDLYARALGRRRRSSPRTSAQVQMEGEIMFRLATFARNPFALEDFICASIYLSTGGNSIYEVSLMSREQLESRLYGRSSGLLEAPGFNSSSYPVQFIHQTAKEFFRVGNGFSIIREQKQGGDQWVGSNNLLFFRFCLFYLIERPSESSSRFVIENLTHYAQRLELDEDQEIVFLLDRAIRGLGDKDQRDIIYGHAVVYHSRNAQALVESTTSPWLRRILFYALFGLPSFFNFCLESGSADGEWNMAASSLARNDFAAILKALFYSLNTETARKYHRKVAKLARLVLKRVDESACREPLDECDERLNSFVEFVRENADGLDADMCRLGTMISKDEEVPFNDGIDQQLTDQCSSTQNDMSLWLASDSPWTGF